MRREKNFIVFEGLDGSGKSSQIELLKQYIGKTEKKDSCIFTFEHTRQGPWSEEIEKIIHGEMPMPQAEKFQLLYILDRKEHLRDIILPALKKGKTVFCDRYMLSTLVYGSFEGTIHWKTLFQYHKDILGDDFILPEKTIFFDVDSDVAMGRISQNREKPTYFETKNRLAKLREAYLAIGKHIDGFETIDGGGTPEEVFEKTKEKLKGYL